jgi:hypothetical protein
MTPDPQWSVTMSYLEHSARCEAFAAPRGWRVARRRFTLAELAAGRRCHTNELLLAPAGIDHTAWFTWPRTGRPAGILTQPYDDKALVDRLRRAFEHHLVPLNVETPPEPSWWFPGRTVSVLFTPRWSLGAAGSAVPMTAGEVKLLAGRTKAALHEAETLSHA